MDNCVYTQTLKIVEFVECFGVTLEYLSIEDKWALRAVLSYWAYKVRHLNIKLTLLNALNYVMEIGSTDCQVSSRKAIDILESITNDELEELVECLNTQLYCL